MDQLFVVTHPDPVVLEARPIDHASTPSGAIALGYYHRGNILARGVVSPEALEAIAGLLRNPVSVALAATEDDRGNIDARVCLVLPIDAADLAGADDEPEEPWRSSLPAPPPEIDASYRSDADEARPRLALLPIGNVVRGAGQRNHSDVASDAREMLDNLLAGRGQDAVARAIDDLLGNL